MANQASNSNSRKCQSSAASSSVSGDGERPTTTSNQMTMVLRVKSARNWKRELREEGEDEERETRPRSAKRSKKTMTAAQKRRIDSSKPKKPPTAFFYFLEDFREGYQEENPKVKSMRDIGKACGEKWKTMTYEEKVKYYDIATEKRAEFERAMAEYIRRKESGEDPEIEDLESDFDGE